MHRVVFIYDRNLLFLGTVTKIRLNFYTNLSELTFIPSKSSENLGVFLTISGEFGLKAIDSFKGAVTDMRYFVRSKFSRSLVHKKSFTLI